MHYFTRCRVGKLLLIHKTLVGIEYISGRSTQLSVGGANDCLLLISEIEALFKSFPRLTAAELISSYPVHNETLRRADRDLAAAAELYFVATRDFIFACLIKGTSVRISESFAGSARKAFTEQRLDYAIKAIGKKKWAASGQKPLSSRPWCSEFFKADPSFPSSSPFSPLRIAKIATSLKDPASFKMISRGN